MSVLTNELTWEPSGHNDNQLISTSHCHKSTPFFVIFFSVTESIKGVIVVEEGNNFKKISVVQLSKYQNILDSGELN